MLAAAPGHAGRAAERGAGGAAAEARRLRGDLVAPGDAGHAVAGEQQQVERRRGEADQTLDLAPPCELACRPVCHGRRF